MFRVFENDNSRSYESSKLRIDQRNNDGHLQSYGEVSSKRTRFSPEFNEQVEKILSSSKEPKLLGLSLTKTPSFMNLIEMKLFRDRQKGHWNETNDDGLINTKSIPKMSDHASQPSEKLKASNFPATLLKIGNWEMISKYENNLVAKCYYAKRKLVWEVLKGALKSKIELQWSDIVAIRAIIHENEPGVLEIELNQPPLFFREINPQPRKHTLWQQTSDFTGGQASIWRRHYVRFPPGMLDKHYEKLLQCDQRLYLLSQRHFPSQECPYFEPDGYSFSQFSFNGYGHEYHHPYQNQPPTAPLLSNHLQNYNRAIPHQTIVDSSSPMSVMDFVQQHRNVVWDQELNTIANVGSENHEEMLPSITSEMESNMLYPSQDYHLLNYVEKEDQPNPDTIVLNDIKNHLLGDSQVSCISDERKLLAKVKSMCSLLELPEDMKSDFKSSKNEWEYRMEVDEGQEMIGGSSSGGGGGVPYPEPINWLTPPQSSNGSSVMQPSMDNSFSPYGWLGSANRRF